jgi:putative endonuclease
MTVIVALRFVFLAAGIKWDKRECQIHGTSALRCHSRGSGNPDGWGMRKLFYVYILASKRNGTLYVGVTSDLAKRVWEHKNKLVKGFTEKYGIDMLVYYEVHADAENAITREKQIKKWNRAWKLRLIEEENPQWKDLFDEIRT